MVGSPAPATCQSIAGVPAFAFSQATGFDVVAQFVSATLAAGTSPQPPPTRRTEATSRDRSHEVRGRDDAGGRIATHERPGRSTSDVTHRNRSSFTRWPNV